MSDDALEYKFMTNAETVIGEKNARQAADLIWRLDELEDVRQILDPCA
jgi:hypothetical protein